MFRCSIFTSCRLWRFVIVNLVSVGITSWSLSFRLSASILSITVAWSFLRLLISISFILCFYLVSILLAGFLIGISLVSCILWICVTGFSWCMSRYSILMSYLFWLFVIVSPVSVGITSWSFSFRLSVSILSITVVWPFLRFLVSVSFILCFYLVSILLAGFLIGISCKRIIVRVLHFTLFSVGRILNLIFWFNLLI